MREAHQLVAPLEERTDVGRAGPELGVVALQVVGAQGVDHDQQHVRAIGEFCRDRRALRAVAATRAEHRGGRETADQREREHAQRNAGLRELAGRAAEELRAEEEEQQREPAEEGEDPEQHRHRWHLLEEDVAAHAEDRDGEPERHQTTDQAERGRPALRLFSPHRQDRQHRTADEAEASEEYRIGERTEPHHLCLFAEAALRDHDRFDHADDHAREHARTEPEAGVRDQALLPRRQLVGRGGFAQRALLLGFQLECGARGFVVVDLLAVDERVAGAVVLAADHPEDEAEERRHLADPEAERGRDDRRRRTDQVADEQQLRGLADAHAADGRPDHGGEDLDGRAEDDRPERGLRTRADGDRHEVVHDGRREVDGEAAEEHQRDDLLLVLIGGRCVRDTRDESAQTLLAGDGQRFDQPLHEPGEEEQREQRADHADRERDREAREERRVLAEDRITEGQRHQEGEEDAGHAEHLLEHGAGGDLDCAAAEARGVVELVAVEACGARQEEADRASDQEGAEDVAEGHLDVLAAQHELPAPHRGEDAAEAHGRAGEHGPHEGGGVDLGQQIDDQLPGRHHLAVGRREVPAQQEPDHRDGQAALERVLHAPLPGLRQQARGKEVDDREGDQEHDHVHGAGGLREISIGYSSAAWGAPRSRVAAGRIRGAGILPHAGTTQTPVTGP